MRTNSRRGFAVDSDYAWCGLIALWRRASEAPNVDAARDLLCERRAAVRVQASPTDARDLLAKHLDELKQEGEHRGGAKHILNKHCAKV
jgi:hypothetical protein